MRILQLTPGTGTFLCGSCLRDEALVTALRRLGHDALIAPLYLPFALEDGRAADAVATDEVHMGGINVYLQQKLPLLGRLPRVLHDSLDSPRLLRFVAGRSSMTAAPGLGALALSMLRGEEGRQRAELGRLVEWLRTLERPDVVILSNAMLVGMAREIRAALECPVIVTLQGEAPFLDSLPSPVREECWAALAERARELPRVIAVSRYTAALMTERLGLDPDRVHVVWNGIALDGFPVVARAQPRPAGPPTIGFLARMCADKGLETLFRAFERVRVEVPDARLEAAGVVLPEDRPLVARLAACAAAGGFSAAVNLVGEVTREAKLAMLARADVFSVPALYGESFGLFLLEAWAAGLPVVQPAHGGFPELVEATGGGVLYDPADERALASELTALLLDPPRAHALGERGRAAVQERFHVDTMADAVAGICAQACGRR